MDLNYNSIPIFPTIIHQFDVNGFDEIQNRLIDYAYNLREEDEGAQKSAPVAELFMTRYEGVLQGNFGQSTRYGESVLKVIAERLPVSTYFGLLTFFITY